MASNYAGSARAVLAASLSVYNQYPSVPPPCTIGCSTSNAWVNFVAIVIGWHPDRAVQLNDFTVEHRDLHDVHDQRTVLVRVAQPRDAAPPISSTLPHSVALKLLHRRRD